MRESNQPKAGFVSIEGRDSIPTGLDAEALYHQLRDAGVAVTGFFNPIPVHEEVEEDVALFDFHAADLALRDQETINREDCKVIAGLIEDLKYRTNSDWNAQMDVVMGKVQVSGPMCAGGSQKGYYASFAEAKSALRALLAFLGPKPERMKAQAGEPPEARTASEWKASVAADRAREEALALIEDDAAAFRSNSGEKGSADFKDDVLTIYAPKGSVHQYRATPEIASMIMDAVEAVTRHDSPDHFRIGDLTMTHVFRPNGLTNLSDLQYVLDATEVALMSLHSKATLAKLRQHSTSQPVPGVSGSNERADPSEPVFMYGRDAVKGTDAGDDQDGEAEAPTASGATNGRVELVLYVDDNRVAEINDLTKLAQIMPQLIEGLTNVGTA